MLISQIEHKLAHDCDYKDVAQKLTFVKLSNAVYI